MTVMLFGMLLLMILREALMMGKSPSLVMNVTLKQAS